MDREYNDPIKDKQKKKFLIESEDIDGVWRTVKRYHSRKSRDEAYENMVEKAEKLVNEFSWHPLSKYRKIDL